MTAHIGLLHAITRHYRLSPGDALDVSQVTWLRFVESIHRLHDPSRVGAWLATTARRECLRVLGQSKRQVLIPDTDGIESLVLSSPVDEALLADERDDEVREAMAELPERCQRLLRLLMGDPSPSYEQVSRLLSMPVGSIGPTRGRCLRRLAALLDERAARAEAREPVSASSHAS